MSGEAQLAYLFKHDMIARCLDFILQTKSPIDLLGESRVKMGSQSWKPSSTMIINLVATMVKRSTLAAQNTTEKVENSENLRQYELSENASQCLGATDFYKDIFSDNDNDPRALRDLIKMKVYNNWKFSLMICTYTLRSIERTTGQCLPQYFVIINDLLEIEDDL